MSDARRRWQQNPFLVLGLGPSATRTEVERAGQKLLGMLTLGLEAAKTYPTPWGPAERDEALVRAALATLRDPAQRLQAELFAPTGLDPAEPAEELGLADAAARLGGRWIP